MVKLEIDQSSLERVQNYLNKLPPRLIAETHSALKMVLQRSAQLVVQKYFAGSGPKGGPTTSQVTSRSGALANSVLRSADSGMDPATPGDNTTTITATLSSSLPYSRIQEYGGVAGRPGPYKKKNGRRPYLPARPYLHPVLVDMQGMLRDLLEQAVARAVAEK